MCTRILLRLFLCLPFFGLSQEYWNLKKESHQIKIYTRNTSNSNLKEFKAVTTINTPSKVILKELLEAPKYYEDCPSNISYYVKKIGNNQHVFYAYKDLPWPIKDRDIVTLLSVEIIDKKTTRLTLESLPNELPKKDKTIRVKTLMGYWLLEEMDNNTKVTQQLFLDPEGNLPSFVVNNLLIKGPYKTFKNLQESVSKTK
ncbi:START domain-containing protein [Psychroserpens sp. MEBiC05023]